MVRVQLNHINLATWPGQISNCAWRELKRKYTVNMNGTHHTYTRISNTNNSIDPQSFHLFKCHHRSFFIMQPTILIINKIYNETTNNIMKSKKNGQSGKRERWKYVWNIICRYETWLTVIRRLRATISVFHSPAHKSRMVFEEKSHMREYVCLHLKTTKRMNEANKMWETHHNKPNWDWMNYVIYSIK